MSSAIKLESKVGNLSDIGRYIKPGSFVAIGGGWSCNKPMAIVREIIRQKISGLKVMSITGGWEMEWLLAAGLVDHLVFSFLSLEFFGLPANFRQAAERKTVKLTEIEGCSMIKGLEAAKFGLPFATFRVRRVPTSSPRPRSSTRRSVVRSRARNSPPSRRSFPTSPSSTRTGRMRPGTCRCSAPARATSTWRWPRRR